MYPKLVYGGNKCIYNYSQIINRLIIIEKDISSNRSAIMLLILFPVGRAAIWVTDINRWKVAGAVITYTMVEVKCMVTYGTWNVEDMVIGCWHLVWDFSALHHWLIYKLHLFVTQASGSRVTCSKGGTYEKIQHPQVGSFKIFFKGNKIKACNGELWTQVECCDIFAQKKSEGRYRLWWYTVYVLQVICHRRSRNYIEGSIGEI